jgi:predicted CXXCH cytochrome family protein
MWLAGIAAVCSPLVLGEGAGAPATPAGPAEPAGATVAPSLEQIERCDECHEMDHRHSHPVGIIPSRPIPAALPLPGGRMVCITCHEDWLPIDHGSGSSHGSSFTRSSNLCVQCHDPTSTAASEIHATTLRRAHLLSSVPADTSEDGLDAESAECIACHDGSIAAGDSIHPVGVQYRTSAPHPLIPLKPAFTLDPGIRLFDDRVGCGSCHSPYSKRPDLLVMSNRRSRLCLSCHDL